MPERLRILLLMPQAFDYSPDSNALQQPLQLARRFETVLVVPPGICLPPEVATSCSVATAGAIAFGARGWQRSYARSAVAHARSAARWPCVVVAGGSQLAVEVAHQISQREVLPWVWLCWDHPFGSRYRSAGVLRRMERFARVLHLRNRLRHAGGIALFYSAECLGEFAMAPEKCWPIGNGVSFARLREIGEHSTRESQLVVMLGQVSRDKGADVALAAFESVCRQRPGARLRLVGAIDPAYTEEFQRRTTVKPLVGRVEWAGDSPFDRAMSLAAEGSVGLCPYLPVEWLRCNQVLKIGEYQALGLVPIATDTPGTRCLVSNERDGLLVRPGDAPHLAEAIERVLDDADLRQRLAAAAIGRARLRDWDDAGDRLAVQLERLAFAPS